MDRANAFRPSLILPEHVVGTTHGIETLAMPADTGEPARLESGVLC